MFKLSIKMLNREKKSSLFYTMTMMIAIIMTFVFSSILNNSSLKSQMIASSGGSWADVNMPISEVLSFVIVCFCCFLIFYVNNYYILNKTDEIAVLSTSGSSSLNTTIYLLYQTALLFLIACIPGFFFGYIITLQINQFISRYTATAMQGISVSSLTFTIILIFTIFIMLVVIVAGYVYRNEIKDILYSKDNMNVTGVMSKLKIPPVLFAAIYLAGIIITIVPVMNSLDFSAQICLCLIGIFGIVSTGVANFTTNWKKKHMYKNRYKTVSLSNLTYTVLKSKWLILLLVFSVTVMFYLTLSYKAVPKEFVIAMAGYIIIIILLSVTIMYNLMIEAKSRGSLYFNMWKVGYVKKELYKIISQELLMYYGLILFLPLLIMLAIGYRFIIAGVLEISLLIFLCCVYIIMILITGLIGFRVYKRTVDENIVGEK